MSTEPVLRGNLSRVGPNVPEPTRYKVTHTLAPKVTLEQVWAWVNERGLDPAQVVVTGGHLSYERDETPDEFTDRVARLARSIAIGRRAVRDRYVEYFGDLAPSQVDLPPLP